jgi:hypothetical protein
VVSGQFGYCAGQGSGISSLPTINIGVVELKSNQVIFLSLGIVAWFLYLSFIFGCYLFSVIISVSLLFN